MTGFVVRYLWRTSPHFAHSLLMATALGLFGVWMVGALAEDGGAPYVLILFGQLFASSSGFRPVADAGRFDALLVRGASRRRLAVTHWLLSAAPGICAWCAVWGAEPLVVRRQWSGRRNPSGPPSAVAGVHGRMGRHAADGSTLGWCGVGDHVGTPGGIAPWGRLVE